jgi:hypothetical protein
MALTPPLPDQLPVLAAGGEPFALVSRMRPLPMRQKTLAGLARRAFPDAQTPGLTDQGRESRFQDIAPQATALFFLDLTLLPGIKMFLGRCF